MDSGATGWQTFRYVVLPNLGSALLAGNAGLRLSFDEIIVTTFTAGHERTLPLWLHRISWGSRAMCPSPTLSRCW